MSGCSVEAGRVDGARLTFALASCVAARGVRSSVAAPSVCPGTCKVEDGGCCVVVAAGVGVVGRGGSEDRAGAVMFDDGWWRTKIWKRAGEVVDVERQSDGDDDGSGSERMEWFKWGRDDAAEAW